MRSSKQRSRSKQNRNRSMGNIVNRVFDSSGPEGKVRGTPQQIIDKYNQLARDAQLSGDRVATENFYQHSEHYTRMLAEAQREQEARREQQEAQNRERQQQRNEQRNGAAHDADPAQQPQPDAAPQPELMQSAAPAGEHGDPGSGAQPDVIDVQNSDTGLVETPESKPAPKPRTRRPRKPAAPKAEAATDGHEPPKAAE